MLQLPVSQMIAKHIKKNAKNTKGDIDGLLKYVEKGEAGKRILLCEFLGEIKTDYELEALTRVSSFSKQPYEHIIFSWQSHEQPTLEQAREAAHIALKHLGCSNTGAKIALHGDTDHLHLHLVVVRVDLDDLHVIKPVFIQNTIQKALAEIVHKQGWEVIPNQPFIFKEEIGIIQNRDLSVPKSSGRINQKATDMQVFTGADSAITQAKKITARLFKQARDWSMLHAELAKINLQLQPAKGGLVLNGLEVSVKLSDISREFSRKKLEDRLGIYTPATQAISLSILPDKWPVTLKKDDTYRHYEKLKKAHNRARKAQLSQLYQRHDEERLALSQQQDLERKAMLTSYEKHVKESPQLSNVLNTLRSVLAFEQAKQKAELADKLKCERAQLVASLPYFPKWQDWLKAQGITQRSKRQVFELGSIKGISDTPPQAPLPQDIRSFVADIWDTHVAYRNQNYDPAFIDKGAQITLYSWQDAATRRASLQLAVQKWQTLELTGSDDYKRAMVRTAVEMNLADRITNPELKLFIAAEKERQQLLRKNLTPQQTAFEDYHKAVRANGYQALSIKRLSDGSQRAFYLGSRQPNGQPELLSAEQLIRQIPRWNRWQQAKKDTLYFIPHSGRSHHIVIDGQQHQLEQLQKDGYQPVAITFYENHKQNYQALLNVPKQSQDSSVNDNLEQQLSKQLNKRYGHMEQTDRIPLQIAPGFNYFSPLADHNSDKPITVAYTVEKPGYCSKATALLKQLLAQQSTPKTSTAISTEAKSSTENKPVVIARDIDQAYQFFAQNSLQYLDGQTSRRQLDNLIIMRLAVLGFTREEIAASIAKQHSALPPAENNKTQWHWQRYADSITASVFNDCQEAISDLQTYGDFWERQLGWTATQINHDGQPDGDEDESQGLGLR